MHQPGDPASGLLAARPFPTTHSLGVVPRGHLSIAAVIVVLLVDRVMNQVQLPFVLSSIDLVGHLATGVLFLAALHFRLPSRFVVGTLVGAVVLDVDHVTVLLKIREWAPVHGRPYSHSLFTMLVILLCAWLVSRWRVPLAGIAYGVASHLVRDLSTGNLPLFWPLSTRQISAPYELYAVIMLILLLYTPWHGTLSKEENSPASTLVDPERQSPESSITEKASFTQAMRR